LGWRQAYAPQSAAAAFRGGRTLRMFVVVLRGKAISGVHDTIFTLKENNDFVDLSKNVPRFF
jgi:hypothetical protein